MEQFKIRKPAVAGQFYPGSSLGLKKQIENLIDKKAEKLDALACMLPHAGYIYSGRVAAETVSHLKVKDKIILLGPNHTGMGKPFSLMADGIWQTPLGEVEIDVTLSKQLLSNSRLLTDEPVAHTFEHSLEVELPFLQYFKTDFKIAPIAILCDDLNALKQMGYDIANTIKQMNLQNSVLIVASSDMTHYEPQLQAQKKDREAIQAILELDEDKLMKKILDLDISMCGYSPVIVMLTCVKQLGARNAKMIRYETSGDVTGDTSSVVGYAGIVVY